MTLFGDEVVADPKRTRCRVVECPLPAVGHTPWCSRHQPLPNPARPQAGKVGHAHPDTSREAAANVRYRVGTQKARLVDALRVAGDRGLTNAEAGPIVGVSRNQAATRMGELREDGWAEVLRDGTRVIERSTDDGVGQFHGAVHVLSARGKAQ